jgi:uncharacterized protein (DUF2236 family)
MATTTDAGRPVSRERDWALGPGAVAWKVFDNPCVFVIGILREAILLTLHLPFAAAAHDHDRVNEDPVKRFGTIARYAYSVVYGTKTEAEFVSGFVRRRHADVVGVEPISGVGYRANSDYELVLTQVLLNESWISAYEATNEALTLSERDEFVVEMTTAGALLGIRPQHLPSSWEENVAFLDEARKTWAAGEYAREILKPFAEGVYPPDSVIGSLPHYKQRPIAVLVRMLTDVALSTMTYEEQSLLAIDRPPSLRSKRAVHVSHRLLSRYLGSARGRGAFDRFLLKDDVAGAVDRAREAELAAGGHEVATKRFVAPDAAGFLATLDDRVENMPASTTTPTRAAV